jgi:hypothetical protein
MADSTITSLPNAPTSSLTGAEFFVLDQAGSTKNLTLAQLMGYAGANLVISSYSIGQLTYSDTGLLIVAQASNNSYEQMVLQNSSPGVAASIDLILSNNLGTSSTYYGDFGMNSSNFAGSGSFNLPNAVYLASSNGELVLGTYTSNGIRFVVNSGTTDAASINSSGVFTIPNVAITGGTITGVGLTLDSLNNTPIGSTTPSTGAFTTLSASGQITSTVATGTAPLVIASTTAVANLNASLLLGATWAAPGTIGSTTPNTGAFTTLSATSTVSGAGFTALFASPPAIGGTTANTGAFSLLSWTNEAPAISTIVSAAGTTVLTASSTYYQRITGTSTQTIQLPNETTIPAGTAYIIDNDSTGNVTVVDSSSTTLTTVTPGMAGYIYSMSNAAATGNWGGYAFVPGNSATGLITWGTAGLNMASSSISGVTTLSLSGVLTSTVATGTAPFSIASTTVVPNLNVSQLLGGTWAVPGTIGSTTPNTGAFTTLTGSTSILSTGAGGVGYSTGAGGTVTQATSRTTGVTLNKTTGAITMFSAAGSTTAATFTVTNSTVAATDTILLSVKSSTNLYVLLVSAVAAGSFNITFYTTGGTSTDAPVINFNVIKGATA